MGERTRIDLLLNKSDTLKLVIEGSDNLAGMSHQTVVMT